MKITNSIFVSLMFVTLFFGAKSLINVAYGVSRPKPLPAEAQAQLPADIGTKCTAQMKDYVVIKQLEMADFINTHFQSPKPTGDLIAAAVDEYARIRDDIRRRKNEFFPIGKTTSAAAISEKPACDKYVEENLTAMKEMLRQHIMNNAYAKKSTILVDKYKRINEKLGTLNFTIAQTYGYFSALSQKLPCYAKSCTK